MNRPLLILILSALLSALAMPAIWVPLIPYGIEGGWLWGRIPWEADGVWDFLLGGLLLFLVGGCYAAIAWKGSERIESASRASLCGWLILLVTAAFGWLFALEFAPPEGYGIEKYAHVIYYKASSGYFTEAKDRKETLGEYLANYEQDIQTEEVSKRVLHHGTHPPGLFIGFRGLIRVCESSPRFVEGVLKTQPRRVSAMFEEMDRHSRHGAALDDSDRAVIWLSALFVQLCGALVVVPLFFLSRQIAGARSAWIAATFWPLVPALAIFLPKSDVLMAFLGAVFLAVWQSGWRKRSLVRCSLAGVLFWLGMMVSLALLPVAFLAGVMAAWDMLLSKEDHGFAWSIKAAIGCLVAGLLGFLLSAGLVSWLGRMNLFAIWWQNYQNHAEFYAHFPRSYWAWFLANPLETVFAVGVPICVCVIFALARRFKEPRSVPLASWGPEVGFLLMMAVLWLSGKNRGEAARLWLVVFPYFVWITSRFWEPIEPEGNPPRRSLVLPLLVLQMLVCWLTVSRVYGFPI